MTKILEIFDAVNSEIPVEDIACPAICGNNIREDSEQCDGTDTAEGLTCNATCKVVCQENHYFDTDQNKCLPNPVCGNNVTEEREICDDGNTNDGPHLHYSPRDSGAVSILKLFSDKSACNDRYKGIPKWNIPEDDNVQPEENRRRDEFISDNY